MEIKILEKENINEVIANVFITQVNNKSNSILGLATGSSPIGVYKKLIEAYRNEKVSFENVTTFNLDEYVGLDGNHDQSYRYFMNENLFNHVNINKANTNVPQGTGNVEENAKNYDKKIDMIGGIDLQILGIGSNSHIAFNEPKTSFDSLTHIVELTNQTRQDNARFFKSIEEVPTHAITMGLKSIMKTKKIVLIATGKNKAQAIKQLVEGSVDINYPASILKNHPDCTIFVDEDAASLLKNDSNYR